MSTSKGSRDDVKESFSFAHAMRCFNYPKSIVLFHRFWEGGNETSIVIIVIIMSPGMITFVHVVATRVWEARVGRILYIFPRTCLSTFDVVSTWLEMRKSWRTVRMSRCQILSDSPWPLTVVDVWALLNNLVRFMWWLVSVLGKDFEKWNIFRRLDFNSISEKEIEKGNVGVDDLVSRENQASKFSRNLWLV